MSAYFPIEGALGAIKTGFELIKGVRELLKKDKVDPAEINNQLLQLQNLLIDARSALTDAGDYIAKVEAELSRKTQIEELEKLMVYDQSVYWKRTGNGNEREAEPYCTVCWERIEGCRIFDQVRPRESTVVKSTGPHIKRQNTRLSLRFG